MGLGFRVLPTYTLRLAGLTFFYGLQAQRPYYLRPLGYFEPKGSGLGFRVLVPMWFSQFYIQDPRS